MPRRRLTVRRSRARRYNKLSEHRQVPLIALAQPAIQTRQVQHQYHRLQRNRLRQHLPEVPRVLAAANPRDQAITRQHGRPVAQLILVETQLKSRMTNPTTTGSRMIAINRIARDRKSQPPDIPSLLDTNTRPTTKLSVYQYVGSINRLY